nr:IS630 family transposase [Aulosira sp. DedVER01a]
MLHYFCVTVLCTTATVRFFCGDETRIGLKTITGKKITAKGIKSVGVHQWKFQSTYLYGIIEPLTGEHFFWEFSHLNTDCFQIFLDLVAQHFSDSFLILQLDNGAFHKAKRLRVPDNIILFFQPSHSPELNPIEQIWQYLKRHLRWLMPKTLDELRSVLYFQLGHLTKSIIASIAGRKHILEALSVAGF